MTQNVSDSSWLKSYLQERAKRVAQPVVCSTCWLLERVMIREWDMQSLWITQKATFPALSNSRHVPETLSSLPRLRATCQKPTSAHPYLLSHSMEIKRQDLAVNSLRKLIVGDLTNLPCKK